MALPSVKHVAGVDLSNVYARYTLDGEGRLNSPIRENHGVCRGKYKWTFANDESTVGEIPATRSSSFTRDIKNILRVERI